MRFRISKLLFGLTLTALVASGKPIGRPTLQQANGDSYTFLQGTGPQTIPAPGLLANDTGTGLTVISNTPLSGPLLGINTVSVNPDGSFTFSGDPSSGTGTDTFTYTASDGTTATVYCTVGSPAPPFVTSFAASPTSITAGQSSTLSWKTASEAPSSVSISPTPGAVPQNGSAVVSPPVGTTTYTISATNSSGTTTATTTVNVTCPALTVNPASLPGGTVGVAYSQLMSASGGTTPYTFTVTTGALPSGLALGGAGAITGSPTTSGTFNFTVTATDANGCTGSRPLSITISPAPPVINSFTASPASINAGNSSMLSWTTSGATTVTIDNGIGAVPSNGSTNVSPTSTTTYLLSASNAGGTTTKTVTVTVSTPGPVINSFTANPTNIDFGQSSTLSWTTTGATTVTIDHGIGTVPVNGSTGVSPTSTTTYTLSATNAGGTITTTATVTVTAVAPPTIDTFNATPASITAGQSSTLSWTTTNATSVSIDNGLGAVAKSGSAGVSPASTTTFTLSASNANGTATKSVTVVVGSNGQLLNIFLSPSSASVERLGSVSFEVRLSQAASSDVRVALTTSDPAVVSLPAEMVIPAGEISRSVAVQGLGAGSARLSASLPSSLGGGVATSTLTVIPIPARIVVSAFPTVLTEVAADGTAASTSFTLSNIGDSPASVSVAATTTRVNFFSVSPADFVLAGNSSQVVTITALPQALPGSFFGAVIVTAGGAQPTSLPVQLLAFAPQGLGIPNVVPVTTRIDLAGPAGVNPTGVLTYRNNGSTRATGVVAPDVPWIIPAPGVVTIEPGRTTDVAFQIDRSRQPATAANGSIQGNATLVYQAGTTGEKLLDSNPAASLVVPITDTRQPQTSTVEVPPLAAGEVALIVPGIGHVTGSGGKEFISDISILNTQSFFAVPDVRLFYSSGGSTVSAPQPVAAKQALQLADAVNTYFKQGTSSQGTLHVRSADTGKLSINANVFNKANPKGTYGSAIPIFRSNRAVGPGETGVLTGLRKDATIHTNLYLQEMAGLPAIARIDFYDASGGRVGGLDAQLVAFGFNAVGAVVPNAAVMATVLNAAGSGRLQAYATPVDDASGDTWAVADWNRQNSLIGSEPMMIPVAGFVPGANGANFRTDIAVTNISAAAGSINLTYYPSGGAAVTRSVTLGRNQTSVTSDVTGTLFGVTGATVGWIALFPQAGSRFAVTSRTYTGSSEPGTFGTGVPTLALNQAKAKGESQIFGGIEDTNIKTQNNRSGNTFRTNIGLVETRGMATTVRVSVSFANGTSLVGGSNGTKNYELAPYQFLQLNGVVRQILGASRDANYGDLHNVQVKIEVSEGSGAVISFVTSTDNGTNDTVLRTE